MSNSKRLVEIAVKATTKEAERGLGKVASGFKGIKAEHALMAGAIAAGAVAIIGALKKTAEAAFDLAAEMAKVGDSFDKMSLRTSLSVETLSEWSYIAQRQGTDLGAMERGVQRMIGTMRDYQEGLSTAVRAWDDLGVSVTNADGSLRDVDGVLYDAREAISRIKSDTEAAALAQEIFGRGGKELIPVLRLSNEEFTEQSKRVRALGGVYDSSVTDSSARFIDAQLDIKTAVEGVKMRLAEAYTEETARAMESIAEAIAKIGETALENVGGIEELADQTAELVEVTAEYAGIIGALAPVLHNVSQIQLLAASNPVEAAKQLDDLYRAVKRLNDELGGRGGGGGSTSPLVFTGNDGSGGWFGPGGDTNNPNRGGGRSLPDIPGAPTVPRNTSVAKWGDDPDPFAGIDSQLVDVGLGVTVDPALNSITDEQVRNWERMQEAQEEFSQSMRDNFAGMTDQLGYLGAEGITTMIGLRDGSIDFGQALRGIAATALEEMIQKLIVVKFLKGALGVPFLAEGGTVPSYAHGGAIKAAAGVVIPPIGQAGMDSVPVMAMPGEGVIKRDTMMQLEGFLNAHNNAASVMPEGSTGGGAVQINYNIARPVAYRDHVQMGRDSAEAMRRTLRGVV